MERDRDVLTTGQVARICRVAPRTVSKWFDSGQLRGYRIPGSKDRRIPRQQLLRFMKAHGLPLDEIEGDQIRVLIVDEDGELSTLVQQTLSQRPRLQVETARSAFEAGALLAELGPRVLVLDIDVPGANGGAVSRFLASRADLQATRLIATGASLTEADRNTLLQEGFDATLAKPYHIRELMQLIEQLAGC